MPHLFAISISTLRLLMLGGAAVILYVVGRVVMGAIPARIDRSMLRAIVASTSVLVVSIVCVLMDRPQVGLHLPIAVAAGAMTFGLAALIIGRPLAKSDVGNVGVRSWAYLLPAVAIALIGGFGGRIDEKMILALAAYGFAALLAWLPDRRDLAATSPQSVAPSATDVPPLAELSPPSVPDVRVAKTSADASRAFALLLWLGGVVLAAIAGMLAMYGLPALDAVRQVPADALATVFLLAPAIVVPMVFELLPPCRSIGWSASASSLAKFALLNLCIVLPLVAMVSADVDVIRGWSHLTAMKAATLPAATMPSLVAPVLTFPAMPAVALRADLLVLAGATLLLLPIAANWTRPGKLEAATLFACYVLNLVLVMGAMLR